MKSIRKLAFAPIAICAIVLSLFALCGCSLQGESYSPELKAPELEPPAVAQEDTLRVGVNTSNSPLAGVSGEKIIGIDVDVAGALGDRLGLVVDLRDVGSDGVDAINNGTVDVVLGVDSDSSETGMWLSSEYIPTGIVLFTLESSDKGVPKAGNNVKIGAQVSSKSAWAITNTFGEKNLVSKSDLATAFQALESGEVDYVASDAIVGLYAANRQSIAVKMVGVMGATSGYCVMANKENVELTKAVGDAITNIVDDGVMDVIELKWLNDQVNLSDLPKINTKKGNNASDAATAESATDTETSTN